MKAVLIIGVAAGLAAISACSEQAPEGEAVTAEATTAVTDAGALPDFVAVAPGRYEVVRADGSIDEMTIGEGMTWSRVFANGDAAGGTIFAQGGKTCFVTEGVEGHKCFSEGPVQEDGSMEVTGEDGEVTLVRPVPG